MKLRDVLGMGIMAVIMAIAVVSYKPEVSYKLADSNNEEYIIDIVNEKELDEKMSENLYNEENNIDEI